MNTHRLLRLSFLALSFGALSLPGVGQACNWIWAPGWSPEEIPERADVRKVRGTYRMLQIAGKPGTDENGEPVVYNAEFRGRLETLRGTGWDTLHEPPMHDLTCQIGNYHKPETDAKGTFWISRRPENGRYRILLWKGDYLPPEERGEPILGGE